MQQGTLTKDGTDDARLLGSINNRKICLLHVYLAFQYPSILMNETKIWMLERAKMRMIVIIGIYSTKKLPQMKREL